MFTQILVLLDGSAFAERALPYVEELARRFGSTVLLLRATTPAEMLVTPPGVAPTVAPVVDPLPIMEAERREADAYLRAIADRLRGAGLSVAYEQHVGHAAEVIIDRARDHGADLIAMTTHGRGGLGRLIFGSVADAVLRSAPCPVFLVRVREAE
jgi:nucleotide-binding universal stress UspA family protein